MLITGSSGSGKSSLALQLIAMGARLVADDHTLLRSNNGLIASRPETLPAKIEARGVGLIGAPMTASCQVVLMIDLNLTESQRMPEHQVTDLLGEKITVWRKVDAPHFPSAIFVYLSSMPLMPESSVKQ